MQRVDVLFLEVDLHAFLLQFPDRCEAVHRIPCKPAHGLGDDKVKLPVQRVLYHFIESAPMPRISRTDYFVYINAVFDTICFCLEPFYFGILLDFAL